MTHRRAIAHQSGIWTPPAGLAAWLYGDSITDGKWTDRSGNARHATLYADAEIGVNGLTLDGTDDYAAIDHDAALSGTAATYCCWGRRSAADRKDVWLNKQNTSGSSYLGVNTEATNMVKAYAETSGGWKIIDGADSIDADEWVHYAVVGETNALRLYVDGNLAASLTGTWALSARTTPLLIGRGYQPNAFTYGVIDDVQIYTAALSSDAIADIYANSPGSHA